MIPCCVPEGRSAHLDIFSARGPSRGAYRGSPRRLRHAPRSIRGLPLPLRSFRVQDDHFKGHRSRVPLKIPQTPGIFRHVPSFRGQSERSLSPHRSGSTPYSEDSRSHCWTEYKIHEFPFFSLLTPDLFAVRQDPQTGSGLRSGSMPASFHTCSAYL